jgi:hypothetical protein
MVFSGTVFATMVNALPGQCRNLQLCSGKCKRDIKEIHAKDRRFE